MHEVDFITLFTAPLEQLQIPYMVTGSVASIVYGEPRLTHDIDIVVALRQDDIDKLQHAFTMDAYYCPPQEVLVVEVQRETRAHFNIIHHATGFKADCYIAGRDPLHHWGMQHRRRIELNEQQALWLAPPEYVIIRKLQYFQEGESAKHIEDCAKMLATVGLQFDTGFLDHTIQQLGLRTEWNTMQALLKQRG